MVKTMFACRSSTSVIWTGMVSAPWYEFQKRETFQAGMFAGGTPGGQTANKINMRDHWKVLECYFRLRYYVSFLYFRRYPRSSTFSLFRRREISLLASRTLWRIHLPKWYSILHRVWQLIQILGEWTNTRVSSCNIIGRCTLLYALWHYDQGASFTDKISNE